MSTTTGRPLPEQPLDRPIRVVLFGGAYFEPAALEFVALLDQNPEIDLVGGFCQSPGFGLQHRVADVVRRRTVLAPAILGMDALRGMARLLSSSSLDRARHAKVRRTLTRFRAVADLHASAVLEQVRALAPDLGLVYGAPRLRPELFEIPAFGTLGIHHGRLPDYRGKKSTFWAMANGETMAGVSIQRINEGLDTGEIVVAGEVPIAGRRYGRVDAEVQKLGTTLYLSAILAVKRAQAEIRPQPSMSSTRLYGQPRLRDFLRLWWRQLPRAAGAARRPSGC